MPAREKPPSKEAPHERKKRLLDQMDEWVHDIDEVLDEEPAIVNPSRS